ncbi:MAG TPA: type II toxin-antitoxin system RelE/ParE family toxin [Bacteroidia bacterium]|nr:type II toxin-antitoxin system RelE/ParE family toxin [Bacteroidia bacterium]
MKITLTDFAKRQVHAIYSYYKETASVPVAKKIKKEIDETIFQLKDFPESGQVEEAMNRFGKKYRRLISGNYKIIYRIEENKIYVTDVFDSRQDPSKIKP